MRGLWLLPALLLAPVQLLAAPRVVTLAPHLAEIVCEVAGCEAVVGVVAYTDFPQALQERPRVGDAWRVDSERVLALQPDMVLAWAGGTPVPTARRLQALGLDVRWVPTTDLEGIADSLELVAEWLGTSERGEAAAEAYRARLKTLRARFHIEASPLRVFFQVSRQPIFTISAASPIDEAIRLCGGVNVFADLGQIAAPVSAEAVLARAPQVIVHGTESIDGLRADWRRLPTLPAVRDEAFVTVPADWLNRPTSRMLDGVEQLCVGLRDVR
jgi:iron complex transport system substrate-binding protein